MVDLVLYITHIYFGVHKSKKIRNENPRTYKGTQPSSFCSLLSNTLANGIGGSNISWGTKK